MGQQHQRLVAASCCIWLLTVVALVSGQAEPDVTELRRAAEQGDAAAQFSLGFSCEFGLNVPQDDGEAARWYRLVADQGNAAAQFSLGFMYANGRDVLQDYEEAVRWYRLAADQGNAIAQLNLGVMHANGWGVPQDDVAAHMWANLAGAQGNKENVRELREFSRRKEEFRADCRRAASRTRSGAVRPTMADRMRGSQTWPTPRCTK